MNGADDREVSRMKKTYIDERGGHSGYQIMWSDKVIAALK